MALWGGRFSEKIDDLMAEFSSSIDVDSRLWEVDVQASVAHVRMLARQKILTQEDADKIVNGLNEIGRELKSGTWILNSKAEDVHGEIEQRLFEKIGEPAKRMHTARSRNDQIATDTRLYLSQKIESILGSIQDIQKTLVAISEAHTDTLLPGLTHMQHAQPVSLAHHMLAYFWMFERDHTRFKESLPRVLSMPLGSAALAGTGFPIDRKWTANELGFCEVAPNSMDAVSDRDFILEFLSHSSITMMHLSRLCEELIVWSTPEFGFVEMSDKVTTGSSIMPQKKNPDSAELIRGRVGRVYGALMGAFTMMKALPLAYNRDMQEDKVHLFTALDTLSPSLRLMNLMLQTAKWNSAKMESALAGDFSNATDLADDLVEKGLSFRQAHEVVGSIVCACLRDGIGLEELSLKELKAHHELFDDSSAQKLAHRKVLDARRSQGGTAPEAVLGQIQIAKQKLLE